jgi:hypothetical protein
VKQFRETLRVMDMYKNKEWQDEFQRKSKKYRKKYAEAMEMLFGQPKKAPDLNQDQRSISGDMIYRVKK